MWLPLKYLKTWHSWAHTMAAICGCQVATAFLKGAVHHDPPTSHVISDDPIFLTKVNCLNPMGIQVCDVGTSFFFSALYPALEMQQ